MPAYTVNGEVLQCGCGTLSHGLLVAGTRVYSGESNGINTTAVAITFDPQVYKTNGRRPIGIRFKSAQVLTIYMGGGAGASTTTANAFSNTLNCRDLFLGKEVWKLKAAAQAAFEYEIDYE